MERKTKEITVDELANNCWSLLLRDVLEKILEKLCFSDCVHAVATCKDWNKIPVPAISKSLPWIFEQDWSVVTGSYGRRQQLCCKLNLYEVSNAKGYPPICRTFDLPGEYDQFRRFQVVGPARVKDSKFGWLLIEIHILISVRKRSRFLVLYNPFVQDHDHRQFTFLPVSGIPMIRLAAFSCPPTSSDCVVYAITEKNRGATSLNIHSWRWCNDKLNWTVESYNDIVIPNCINIVVAMKEGTLYCLGKNAGNLTAFKYSSNSNQLVQTISVHGLDLVGRAIILTKRFIERDGQLFLVCFCRFDQSSSFHMVIYRYDTSANCWFMKQRSDHPISSSLDPAVVQIGSRPCFWRRGLNGLMFYCFEDGKPARVATEEIFPSYHHHGSEDTVQLLSMGPSLA